MGESTERKRGTIKHEHGCSLYADDAVFFFNSRDDLENGASCLHEHLLKLGLTMHIGTGATPSKTEAIYFSPPRRLYSDAYTSRLGVLDYLGNPVIFIDFTTEFKYLGSIAHHSQTSDASFMHVLQAMVNVVGNDLRNEHAIFKTGISAFSGAVRGNMESKKRLTKKIVPDMIIKAQDGITNNIMLDFKSLCSTSTAYKHA